MKSLPGLGCGLFCTSSYEGRFIVGGWNILSTQRKSLVGAHVCTRQNKFNFSCAITWWCVKTSGQKWTSILLVDSQIVHIVGNSVTKEQKMIVKNGNYVCVHVVYAWKMGKLICLVVSVVTPPKATNSKKIYF